jgi:hypothetical protein
MSLVIFNRPLRALAHRQGGTVRRPVPRFCILVVKHGLRPTWSLFSVVVGAGALGVIAWVARNGVAAVGVAFLFVLLALLVLGSYRAWLDAEQFRPTLGTTCRVRADTLNAFLRANDDPVRMVKLYHANHAQDTLYDFDLAVKAGYLDGAGRSLVADPQSPDRISDVVRLFESASDAC